MIFPLYNDIYNVFGIHDIFQLKHNNKCLLTDFSDKDSHNVRPSESYNMLRFKSNLTVLVSVKVYGNFLKFSKGHFKILLKSYVTRLLSRHETIYIRRLFTFCLSVSMLSCNASRRTSVKKWIESVSVFPNFYTKARML